MKQALLIAAVRAVRTYAQTMAGGLGTVGVYGLSRGDFHDLGTAVALTAITAALAALVAFCQNLAENIPD